MIANTATTTRTRLRSGTNLASTHAIGSIQSRLAADMREIGEGCTRQDLLSLGWNAEQLDANAEAANRIARERAGDAR